MLPKLIYLTFATLFLLLTSSWANDDNENVVSLLKQVSLEFEERERSNCRHESDLKTSKELWPSKPLQNNFSVVIFVLCHDSFAHQSTGNHLLNYFNHASCARVTGAHFLSPHLVHSQATSRGSFKNEEIFFNALPEVQVHDESVSPVLQAFLMERDCQCVWNCMHKLHSPWLRNIPWIVKHMRVAIAQYLGSVDTREGTVLNNATDLLHPGPALSLPLPLIPDTTIHYRCGDNLDAEKAGMPGHGLLAFPQILRRVPPASRSVYILSESPGRFGKPDHNAQRCSTVLRWLFDALVEQLPGATIVLKRGGDAFLDLARIAYANTTIASSSTFAFFPALASNGTVFLPTSAIFPPANVTLGPYFHWIEAPLISSGWPSPWSLLRFPLFERTMTVSDMEGHVVKMAGNKSVYLVKQGKKHTFNSGSDFEALGFDWGDIWIVDEVLLKSVPQGEDVSPPSHQ